MLSSPFPSYFCHTVTWVKPSSTPSVFRLQRVTDLCRGVAYITPYAAITVWVSKCSRSDGGCLCYETLSLKCEVMLTEMLVTEWGCQDLLSHVEVWRMSSSFMLKTEWKTHNHHHPRVPPAPSVLPFKKGREGSPWAHTRYLTVFTHLSFIMICIKKEALTSCRFSDSRKDQGRTSVLILSCLHAAWGDLWGSAEMMTSSCHAVSDDAGFSLLSWHLLNTSTPHLRLCPASCCAHYLMLPKCVQQSGEEGRRKDHEKVSPQSHEKAAASAEGWHTNVAGTRWNHQRQINFQDV